MQRTHVGIIGAGPYGLAAAAHLRAAGIDTHIFGKVMEFWKNMPKGMLLRSEWDGSHISDPDGSYSLDAYVRHAGRRFDDRMPMSEFAAYGEWFQRNAVGDVDSRSITHVERSPDGFVLTVEDGEQIQARRVVVATGLGAFARRPAALDDLPKGLVSHTSEERDFGVYAGKSVMMLGSGQSALECAALLNEGGANVEVLVRGDKLYWLAQSGHISRESGRFAHMLYPPGAVGPLGVNWVVQLPTLYRACPSALQQRVFDRALRPAGSGWVKPRTQGVVFTTNARIAQAEVTDDRLFVTLGDGSTRVVDHVVLGTGYKVEVDRYDFLDHRLKRAIATVGTQPKLRGGFESSVSGLHFLGAPSDLSYGPLMRFVAGTGHSASALSGQIQRDRRPIFTLSGLPESLTAKSAD